jgi:predicted unusual protein kinase regulating ubiquinone biosynthesis (AarF/ABC1/UbiB family)
MSEESNLAGRVTRLARVGAGVGATVARVAAGRLLSSEKDLENEARLFREALGSLKGPLMKVAQLIATIPDAIPAEYAAELSKLQSHAPPFVRRRMAAELGADWQARFASFDHEAIAAASLGQVHRAVSKAGEPLACKLQYPDMASAVEADLQQLKMLFSLHRRMDPAIDTSEIGEEIGARLREELDYSREAAHIGLYTEILRDEPLVRIPRVHAALSTRRLLTMGWLDGRRLTEFKDHSLEERNLIATAMFKAWWRPFCSHAVIHGDPHLGNYSAFADESGRPAGINLLDYGCIRIFPAKFVSGVVDLYQGLLHGDEERVVHAYEVWGFKGLRRELIDILNIWAKFIYGPLLEDRVRTVADGVAPGEYGRRQAFQVHKALKEKGPVTVPREFVFMDRAAIGLGAVFIHLNAELNFHRLFNETLEDFSLDAVGERQRRTLAGHGLAAA